MTNKDNDMEEKLKKITKHFGIETELTKLTEEMGELLNECYKRHFVDPEYGEIEDEMADVLVILLQIMLHFNVDVDKVTDTVEHKIERTVKRIEEGWYDKHR